MGSVNLPRDMAAELEKAQQWTADRATERELLVEVEPEWLWVPELLRWVPLEP
jgi:hypothetical protein